MILKIKNFIQNFLAISIVRKILITANYLIYFIVSKLSLLSAVFLSFITFGFLREQNAVASGILQYYKKALSKKSVNWALIRRNTHRIEKGLILKPRKKIFALNFIEETILEFIKIDKTDDLFTTKWCADVLVVYFYVIENNSFTDRLKKLFEQHLRILDIDNVSDIDDLRNVNGEDFSPYLRNVNSDIKFESLLKLSKTRRSVRYFDNRKVDNELIDKALLIARQAPSACNRLPYKYIFFNDKELATEIASIPFGTLGYASQIPCIAVLIGDLSYYPSTRDRHIIYVDSSLSAMSFLFALETLGLSACTINWPDFGYLEHKMAKRLKLKNYERVIMLIGIGYADHQSQVPYSKKKALNDLREFRKK